VRWSGSSRSCWRSSSASSSIPPSRVYTTQQSEAYGLGPVVIELDVVLEEYGPEALRGRVGLREALGRSRKRFFGDLKHGPQAHTFEETRATMHWMNTYFDNLQPSTDRQRQLLTSARDLAKTFAETQMLMARQLANPFPPQLLVVVILWASALFLGNGLVAAPNAVAVTAHLLGAIAVASAVFLILELSHPYSGVIRPRPAAGAAWGPREGRVTGDRHGGQIIHPPTFGGIAGA